MAFDDKSIMIVFDKIVSYALSTGRFDHVNQHEPKSAPGHGLECSVWINSITPVRTSGLSATSGLVIMYARIYTNFKQQPFDMIDPNIMAGVADLMRALTGDFDFGGDANVRNIDVLGSTGNSLGAQAGYVEIDRQMFRVMTVTIPIIINDMFSQVA